MLSTYPSHNVRAARSVHRNQTAIRWQSHGNHMAITCNHMAVTWHSHGDHTAVTWRSHGDHMAIAWQSPQAVWSANKLGAWVTPTEIVDGGSKHLHGVTEEGLRVTSATGHSMQLQVRFEAKVLELGSCVRRHAARRHILALSGRPPRHTPRGHHVAITWCSRRISIM